MKKGEAGEGTEMRSIPQVDKLLRHPLLEQLTATVRHDLLCELARQEIGKCRQEAREGKVVPDLDALAEAVARHVHELFHGGARRVINGTGVILNTNLGRAPLATAVIDRLQEVLPGYCSLEIELESGKRGERTSLIERLLVLLTGCEAAIVVNNNAAAVMLAVTALAHGKEVIVSRGELIEIGGSFRLPDVINSAGGVLKEVGTTNRTRAEDYKRAVGANSGIIMRCHRSNFEIRGFTQEPTVAELAELSRSSSLPFVEDLGSGAIIDLTCAGLKDEPTVGQVLAEGADLVLFSGDKLLGGVQAGIIVGKRSLVERLRKHPIYRALRPDKMIVSVLEVALAQSISPKPQELVPALRMATQSKEELRVRAEDLAKRINRDLSLLSLRVESTLSAFGGGTAPSETLAGYGLCLEANCDISADKLSRYLRSAPTPVVAVVSSQKVTIDIRTVAEGEESLLATSLKSVDEKIRQIKRL